MFVALYRERLEATLVQVSGSAGPIVRVKPHRVSHRQPPEELADLIVGSRPRQKVPVIPHQDHRVDRQRDDLPGFVDHPQKRVVILRLLEDRQTRHRSVEYVDHVFL